jgi:hypothetical protein
VIFMDLGVLDRTMVASESAVYADLDGEAVLLNVDTGIYYGLDEVGTAIWRVLERGACETEIVERLLEEYDVEPAQLRGDVSTFLALLVDKGLAQDSSG